MMAPESTRERLAADLAAIPGVPPDMVDRARAGHYDDYLSDLATPIVQLVADLEKLTRDPSVPHASQRLLHTMAIRASGGEYDSTLEEGRAWVQSPEGREAARELGL